MNNVYMGWHLERARGLSRRQDHGLIPVPGPGAASGFRKRATPRRRATGCRRHFSAGGADQQRGPDTNKTKQKILRDEFTT